MSIPESLKHLVGARPSMPMISMPPAGCPGPVETDVHVANARSGGDTLVMMQVATRTGVQFFFWTADVAVQIVESMNAAISRARSGLIVPP